MKINTSFIQIFEEILNKHYKPTYNSRKIKEIEYFKEIMNVLKSNTYWSHYKGPINYKVLNNKHNEYIKKGLYDELYKLTLGKYLNKMGKQVLKYQSTDTSFIFNKKCRGLNRNKYFKSKKGVKISTINDANGIPLSIFVSNGNVNDAHVFHDTYKNMLVDTETYKYKNVNKHKHYFLADKGYDSNIIRNMLIEKGYYVIIPFNKRNTKNISKIKEISDKENIIYKKRIVVENYFAWIKNIPKIMNVIERSIKSYEAIVKIMTSKIIFERFIINPKK
jgi:transposase